MKIVEKSDIKPIIERYPDNVKTRFIEFKELLLNTASALEDVTKIDEDIKWGEPSYMSNIGSPVRFGWSEKRSDQFRIHFICSTNLVETFHRVYPDLFLFDGNRGLIFDPDKSLESEPLNNCLKMALRYKKVRNLPDLGA
ncbi:MAG: hypothetical protein JJ895_01505 [Balneolaceae bacterium]|nr:hypothetical protein [Balneolaceae bacterium]